MEKIFIKLLRRFFLKCSDHDYIRENSAAFEIEALLNKASKSKYSCLDLHLRCEYELAATILERYLCQLTAIHTTLDTLAGRNSFDLTRKQHTQQQNKLLCHIKKIGTDLRSGEDLETISTSELRRSLQTVYKSVVIYIKKNDSGLNDTEFNIFMRNIVTATTVGLCCIVCASVVFGVLFGAYYKTLIIPAIVEYQNYKESNRVFDLLDRQHQPDIVSDNLSPIEIDKSGKSFRWALGNQFAISFYAKQNTTYQLDFELFSYITNQEVAVIVNNGEVEKKYVIRDPGRWLESNALDSFRFEAKPGINSIVFVFSDYNHFKTTFEKADGRNLAAAFTKIKLYPAAVK